MSGADSPASGRRVRAPILVVGAPRSGTTWLGNRLGRHPEVAYWEEPRPIWSTGHAWRGDDALAAADLSPAIARRIDDRFARFLVESGRRRFCEKTPSNCLRLRFIAALYPDARVIHLVRDGRSVVASLLGMLERPPDSGRIAARWRETPWRDLPALVPLFCRDVIGRRLRGSKSHWGPRPPGWREWRDLPPATRLARQWRVLVETARRDLEAFPADQRLTVRLEDLAAAPGTWLDRILATAGLPADPAWLEEAAGSVRPASSGDGRGRPDPETARAVEAEAGRLLTELGYLPAPRDP